MATTATRLTALETTVAALDSKFDLLLARLDLDAPAVQAPAPKARKARAPKAQPVTTKPLSRGAWQELRRTRGGVVKAAFKGLTREQAFEAGLCPGFHLPTGAMKAAIKAA